MNNISRKAFKKRLDELRSLRGYTAGKTLVRLAQELGIEPSEIVKLNSNENFFLPREELVALLMEAVEEIDPRIYPGGEEIEVKEALGKYLHVPPECVMVGSGSDPLISLITQLFLEKGDTALSIAPTFSLYHHLVNLRGAKYLGVPLKDDFSLDIEGILTNVTPRTRGFFLCSPNNPTANQFKIEEVRSLIKEIPGLVAVDEAYVEFADYSVTPIIEEFESLIVFRTFSKAFGLAGLRLGYAVANPDLATTLSGKAQLPYPVSSFALRMGLKLLAKIEIVKKAVERLKRERERLIGKLNGIEGIKAFNSQTNFVIFRTNRSSDQVFQALLNQGILVRNMGEFPRLKGYLRTTVGLPEMNDKLLNALKQICGEEN